MSVSENLLLCYVIGIVANYGFFVYRMLRPLPEMNPYLEQLKNQGTPLPIILIGLLMFALAWPVTMVWAMLSKGPSEEEMQHWEKGGKDDNDPAP